jgi:hypothetical protein
MGRRGVHIGIGGESRRDETTGKNKRKWGKNIKMDRREKGWDDMIGLIWLTIGVSGELL